MALPLLTFQQLLSVGRPSDSTFLSSWGLDYAKIHYAKADIFGYKPATNEKPTQQMIIDRAVITNTEYSVIDLENYEGFKYGSSDAESEIWDADIEDILNWYGDALPSGTQKYGVYRQAPYRYWYATQVAATDPNNSEVLEWKRRNELLNRQNAAMTASFPGLYTLNEDHDGFYDYVNESCKESKRLAPGLKAIAYLWPQYHTSYTPRKYEFIAGSAWRNQLEACRDSPYCDGFIIWGLFAPHYPTGETESYTAWSNASTFDWWTETVSFMASLASGDQSFSAVILPQAPTLGDDINVRVKGSGTPQAQNATTSREGPTASGAPQAQAATTTAAVTVFSLQFGRPGSDISAGTWTPSAGGDLYAVIDETSPSDADYIDSAVSPSADTSEVKLTGMSEPFRHNYHRIRYRYQKIDAGTIDLTAELRQGTSTLIKQWVHTGISTSIVEAVQFLSEAEAANITDYTDLRLRFIATAT